MWYGRRQQSAHKLKPLYHTSTGHCDEEIATCWSRHSPNYTFYLFHRKDWVAHFPNRNLEAYSAMPLLVNPTHYVGDKGWFSDTEPPPEVLEQIRQRKKLEEEQEEEKRKKEKLHQEMVREQAMKRQVEKMKMKLKPKTEL